MLNQQLISQDKYSKKCPYSMTPEGICVHNTWNDASAQNEVDYMKRNNNSVSFHVAVDDKEAIQAIPFNRNAWASGDGKNGTGNRKFIHYEICYSKSGGTRFAEAEKRCAREIAEELKRRNWGITKVRTHQSFSPEKKCPHRTIDMGWNRFLNMIQAEMEKLSGTPSKPSESNPSTSFLVKVTCDVLNVRAGAGTKYKVTTKVKKGEVYTIVDKASNWGKLKSGAGWICLDYTKRV